MKSSLKFLKSFGCFLFATWFAALLSAPTARAQTLCPEGNDAKWTAPPNLNGGWDVKDSRNSIVLADDFPCTTTGPITDIHIWGSWNNDFHGTITNFWLGVFTDVPAVTNAASGQVTPSHPGQLLWQQSFLPGQFVETPYSPASEQFYNPTNLSFMGGDTQAWYYCFYPTNPVTQYGTAAQPTNYWLAARAQLAQDGSLYGWKTSTTLYNDAAVWGTVGAGGFPNGDWQPMINSQTPTPQPVNLAFKINTTTSTQTCCPDTNVIKYVQFPNLVNGLDVDASLNRGFCLADDFPCTSPGPITDIHLWGSWQNDQVDPNAKYILAIWADVPAPPAGGGSSHPGNLLWTQTFTPGNYVICNPAFAPEGFSEPATGGLLIPNGVSTNLYYLCFYAPSNNIFYQTGTATAPTNYWLSVSVQSAPTANYLFGWKSSTNAYNDAAVFANGFGPLPPPTAWNPLFDPNLNNKLNLAFKINTATNQCTALPVIQCSNQVIPCGTAWTIVPPPVIDYCCPSPTPPATLAATPATNFTACSEVVTLVWQYTDCQGRTVNCNDSVTITDTNQPVFNGCINSKIVQCGTSWNFDTPTATYPCTGSNAFVGAYGSILVTSTSPCSQNQKMTWSATNACSGAVAYCSETVTVLDTNAPILLNCGTNMTVILGTPWTFTQPTAQYVCSGSNVFVGILSSNVINLSPCTNINTIVWSATNQCSGAYSTCAQIVTVICAPTGCVDTNGVKYVQWPNTNHGYDVWNSSTFPPNANDGPWVLADDFICTNTGYITDIHLWGSWWYDFATNNVTFWLGLFDDVATNANNPYSHPGNLFWSQCFAPGEYSQTFWSPATENFLDPGTPNVLGSDSQVWYYCFYPAQPPLQRGLPYAHKTYWLAVYAQLPANTPNYFGWKTTTNVQHDISVHSKWIFGSCPTNLPQTATAWQPTRDVTGLPLDLAFEITTATNCASTFITIDYPATNIVVLTWPRGILQVSTNVIGTYVDVPGAVSPYTNTTLPFPPTNRFYRIRCP